MTLHYNYTYCICVYTYITRSLTKRSHEATQVCSMAVWSACEARITIIMIIIIMIIIIIYSTYICIYIYI